MPNTETQQFGFLGAIVAAVAPTLIGAATSAVKGAIGGGGGGGGGDASSPAPAPHVAAQAVSDVEGFVRRISSLETKNAVLLERQAQQRRRAKARMALVRRKRREQEVKEKSSQSLLTGAAIGLAVMRLL